MPDLGTALQISGSRQVTNTWHISRTEVHLERRIRPAVIPEPSSARPLRPDKSTALPLFPVQPSTSLPVPYQLLPLTSLLRLGTTGTDRTRSTPSPITEIPQATDTDYSSEG